MTAFRRTSSNFALERAVELARAFSKPLVVLEALRVDYPHASDRLHRFVIEGMRDNARALASRRVSYFPYVETAPGAGQGLVATLARDSCAIVTDDCPAFFLPRMLARAAATVRVRVEAVDSNGLLPMRAVPDPLKTARSFRAHMQRTLRTHLADWPSPIAWDALASPVPIPKAVAARWPPVPRRVLDHPDGLIARLPIDHGVGPAAMEGGPLAGRNALQRFVADRLGSYAGESRHPDVEGTSGLSPYLHFGHVSAHDVFSAVMTTERWTSRRLAPPSGGRRDGWWGVSAGAEAFLDQLLVWRELALNMCVTRPDDYGSYRSLPAWAQATLARHADDARPWIYSRRALETAGTHDALWNAAERQLVRDGWMHNYLRMLWGKKIVEWSPTPQTALARMIAIMNRYAVDGRDPNSYAGYLWTLGRYDRPWGPERPIFGTVRYMSSESARRKLHVRKFLAKYRP